MEQRICLITGSHKGLGFETARQLGLQGIHVIISARDAGKGHTALEKLVAAGISAEAMVLDVTSEASVQALMQAVNERYGKLDILINNAGVNIEYSAGLTPETLTVEHLRKTYETNVFGVLRMIQAATPLLAKGDEPRIINISSTLGSLSSLSDPQNMYYSLNSPAYNSSKTAVNALTVAYGKAFAEKGITVTSICPGWVQTDIGTGAAPRTVEEGVRIIVQVATMDNPPNGGLVDESGTVAW